MIRRHEAFLTSMDAHDDKIKEVKAIGDKLIAENHYASEKIKHRTDTITDRQRHNRQKALDRLEKLRDALQLQLYLQECDEVLTLTLTLLLFLTLTLTDCIRMLTCERVVL
jgi:spectrin beta